MTTQVGSAPLGLGYTKDSFFGVIMAGLDIAGQRFGRLIAIDSFRRNRVNGKSEKVWNCACDCGGSAVGSAAQLRSGGLTSCGCRLREHASKMNASHGMTGTKVYRAWKGIKRRCLNPSEPAYKNYGGRGVSIYPEWAENFELFYAEIGDPPTSEHTVERINNDLGYIPGNVKWATRLEQRRNRRSNVFYEYNGHKYMLRDLSEKYGISFPALVYRIITKGWTVKEAVETPVNIQSQNLSTMWNGRKCLIADIAKATGADYRLLRSRILSGWPVEDAIQAPAKEDRRGVLYEFNGQQKTISEWSRVLGIELFTLHARIHRRNWSIEKAFTTPVRRKPLTKGC